MNVLVKAVPPLFLLVALVGCSTANPPSFSSTPAAPTARASVPNPAAGSASATLSAPAVEPPWAPVLEADGEIQLYPAQNVTLVRRDTLLGQIENDHVVFNDRWSAGLGNATDDWSQRITALTGTWPDALWATVSLATGRTGATKLLHWAAGSWRPEKTSAWSSWHLDVATWKEGRVITAVARDMFQAGYSFVQLQGPPGALPKPAKPPPAGAESPQTCTNAMVARHLLAFPTGEIFAVGDVCRWQDERGTLYENTHTAFWVERWPAGARTSRIEQLPLPPLPPKAWIDVRGVGGTQPNDLYVYGVASIGNNTDLPLLVHWDGTAWTTVTSPLRAPVEKIFAGEEGLFFVTAERDSFHAPVAPALSLRTASGTWSEVPLPRNNLPAYTGTLPPPPEARWHLGKPQLTTEIWARSTRDIWMVVGYPWREDGTEKPYGSTAASVLLHSLPGSAERTRLPGREKMQSAFEKVRAPVAATATCPTVFAMLYALDPKAPADFAYPATGAALRGHNEFARATFREFAVNGRRYFGASTPDLAMGKKLVQLIREKVPGAKPLLECRSEDEMPRRREFSVDVASGKLAPTATRPAAADNAGSAAIRGQAF